MPHCNGDPERDHNFHMWVRLHLHSEKEVEAMNPKFRWPAMRYKRPDCHQQTCAKWALLTSTHYAQGALAFCNVLRCREFMHKNLFNLMARNSVHCNLGEKTVHKSEATHSGLKPLFMPFYMKLGLLPILNNLNKRLS